MPPDHPAASLDHQAPASRVGAITSRAKELAVKVRPNFNEAQRRALDAGTNAVVGTLANVTIAAMAGLVGGRMHPRAPEVLYAIFSVGIGVGVAERNPAIGTMLASGGMVAMAGMAMRAVATAITGSSVSTDPFELASRVGQAVGEPSDAPTTAATGPQPPAATTAAATEA